MANINVTVQGGAVIGVQVGEQTLAAVNSANAAAASAETAEASADLAAIARDVATTAGPHYPSIAAGEAATAVNDSFAVAPGDGSVTWYRRTSGGSVALFAAPTAATQAKLSTRLGIPALAVGGVAYASDVDAYYTYDAASTATADGWGVIAPNVGGGRWVLSSAGVTVRARGGTLDDTPNLTAAANAMANLGRKLFCFDPLYRHNTRWVWPVDKSLHLVSQRSTRFRGFLTPDGDVTNAPWYCGPGGAALIQASTVSAANQVTTYTLQIAHAPSVGQWLRVRDNPSGDGFTGSTFRVMGVSGTGPFTVTVDRPVRFGLQSGDAADIFATIPVGHRVEGYPTIDGSGTRLIEFICVAGCDLELNLHAGNVTDVAGSFDTFGIDNRIRGTVTKELGSPCLDGFFLESQENSVCDLTVKGFSAGRGVTMFHCIRCIDRSLVTGCQHGVVIGGYTSYGSLECQALGQYDANTVDGISVINGSISTQVRPISARYNPINLRIGDAAGGTVQNTIAAGDFAAATQWGILVEATTSGTALETVDTSDSQGGIVTNGAPLTFASHIHSGFVSSSRFILFNNNGDIFGSAISYNVTVTGQNLTRLTGAGARTTIRGGAFNAGSGCNLFDQANGTLNIGAVKGVTSGGFAISSAGGRAVLSQETDFSGCAAPFTGTGIFERPAVRLADVLGATVTTAVTTEETLKTTTVTPYAVVVGEVLEFSARGTTAANANGKTIRLKFGGQLLVEGAGGNDTDWSVRARVNVTSPTAQEYEAVLTIGGSTTTAVGALTVDVTNNPAVTVTGQNAVASAGDIGSNALAVVRSRL